MPITPDELSNWKAGRLSVLIVGAGISGLTLAALLRRQDVNPLVIERAPNFDVAGYSLGVYPIGSRVLYGLGVHDAFMNASVPYDGYELHDGTGTMLKHYDLRGVFDAFGPFRGLRRVEMLAVLKQAVGDVPVHFESTVASLQQDADGVNVTFEGGAQRRFDVVIGADGMHSSVRKMVLSENEYAEYDTGWAAWVLWTKEALAPPDCVKEFWSPTFFFGIYPVKDELMVCFAGPKRVMLDEALGSPVDRARTMLASLDPTLSAKILALLAAEPKPFFWDLHDYRTTAWHKGRVALVGDAAAGFLPTAGIGSSMAMNDAASLGDELSRTDARYVEVALRAYERRQKKRTERAQSISRELGKMMFVESRPLSWLRDEFSKAYTVHQFAHDTLALMDSEL